LARITRENGRGARNGENEIGATVIRTASREEPSDGIRSAVYDVINA